MFFYVLNPNKSIFISVFQSAVDWKWIKQQKIIETLKYKFCRFVCNYSN